MKRQYHASVPCCAISKSEKINHSQVHKTLVLEHNRQGLLYDKTIFQSTDFWFSACFGVWDPRKGPNSSNCQLGTSNKASFKRRNRPDCNRARQTTKPKANNHNVEVRQGINQLTPSSTAAVHWQPCRRRYSSDQSQCSRVLCNAVPSERDTKIIKACTSQIQGNDQGPSQVCNPSRQANADPSITLQAGQSKRFQCSNLRRPCLSHRETSNHQSNTLWQKANHINHPSTNQARSSCLNALLAAIKVQRQSCSHMLKQRQQRSPMLHASKIRHRKTNTLKQLAQSELRWRRYKVSANPPIGSFRISMAKLSEQLALCQPGGESEMTKDNNDRGSTIHTGLGPMFSSKQQVLQPSIPTTKSHCTFLKKQIGHSRIKHKQYDSGHLQCLSNSHASTPKC